MTARSPVLYLPIEEKGREFDSKLLIGAAAAERGFSVVIGQVWAMSSSFDRMPPGVVLFKGVNKIQLSNMRFAARHGHLVAAIDEEALGLAHPRFLARDVDPRFPETCDALLAQGQFQARVMHDVVGMAKSKIFVTGNPRTDPLRPPLSESYEADDAILRRRHGRFVVVNSTCGGVNSPWGDLEGYRSVLKGIGWLDPDKPEDEIDYRDHIEHDTLNMEALKALLKRLPEALPEHNIVLRPHPSERARTWIEFCQDIPRTEVVVGTSAAPYTFAAELLIHTGCTTGVEAAIAGQPAVSLAPAGARIHDQYLSNSVNPTAATPDDAVQLARAHLHDRTGAADPRADRMDDFLRLEAGRFAFDNCAFVLWELMRERGAAFEDFRWSTTPDQLRHYTQTDQQRAKMTLGDADIIERFKAMSQVLGRFRNVAVLKLTDSVYVLEARR